LTADASERGWGAVLRVGEALWTAFRSFTEEYTSGSSNLRETTAVLLALLYFKQMLRNRRVRGLTVRTDNTVTVFNLQRQGASQPLLYETDARPASVRVTHIPGVENEVADALSRMGKVGDYSLKEYSWAGELPYAFPPVQHIPRVLQKIRKERGAAVMVIPEWPSRA
jgi:ribonuclease HI